MNNKFLSLRVFVSTFLILASSLLFTSCLKSESDYDQQVKIDDEKIDKFLTDNSIQAQKHSTGFYYNVLTPNTSGRSLAKDDVVSFYYTVSLLNGTVIESNYEQEKPVRFKLLSNTIIPQGLDNGISMMKVGEKYRFFIPSYLAYGSYACTDFSTNSIFIIDVEVVKVETEAEIDAVQMDSIQQVVNIEYPQHVLTNSGLYFIDSIPGTGERPYNGNLVTFDFKRKYLNNTLIRSAENVSVYLDRGQAVQGLEEGLKLMKREGSAILIMPSKIAFKQSLCVIPQKTRTDLLEDKLISSEVMPYSIVKYAVTLKTIFY